MPYTHKCWLKATMAYEWWILQASSPPPVRTGSWGGYSSTQSAVYFNSLLRFTVLQFIKCAANNYSTASSTWILMVWSSPSQEYSSFHRAATGFMYIIGRSFVLNIKKSPTSWLDIHSHLFSSTFWLSCAPRRRCKASSNVAFTHSMKGNSSRHHITFCWNWLPSMSERTRWENPGSSLHRQRMVDQCVDMLKEYSASGSVVSHWSRWWVSKACRYQVTYWLKISYSLLVCGWNDIDMSSMVCNLLLTSAQEFEVKHMSLWLNITGGTPKRGVIVYKKSFANSAASIILVQGL